MAKKKTRWHKPTIEPVISRVRHHDKWSMQPLDKDTLANVGREWQQPLRETLAKDRRGYAGGLRSLNLDWHTPPRFPKEPNVIGQYDIQPDEVRVDTGHLGDEKFERVLLHELAHRGQYRLHDQDYEDFKNDDLGKFYLGNRMENPYADSEVFANSYADYILGRPQVHELVDFWRKRLSKIGGRISAGRAYGGRAKARADRKVR